MMDADQASALRQFDLACPPTLQPAIVSSSSSSSSSPSSSIASLPSIEAAADMSLFARAELRMAKDADTSEQAPPPKSAREKPKQFTGFSGMTFSEPEERQSVTQEDGQGAKLPSFLVRPHKCLLHDYKNADYSGYKLQRDVIYTSADIDRRAALHATMPSSYGKVVEDARFDPLRDIAVFVHEERNDVFWAHAVVTKGSEGLDLMYSPLSPYMHFIARNKKEAATLTPDTLVLGGLKLGKTYCRVIQSRNEWKKRKHYHSDYKYAKKKSALDASGTTSAMPVCYAGGLDVDEEDTETETAESCARTSPIGSASTFFDPLCGPDEDGAPMRFSEFIHAVTRDAHQDAKQAIVYEAIDKRTQTYKAWIEERTVVPSTLTEVIGAAGALMKNLTSLHAADSAKLEATYEEKIGNMKKLLDKKQIELSNARAALAAANKMKIDIQMTLIETIRKENGLQPLTLERTSYLDA